MCLCLKKKSVYNEVKVNQVKKTVKQLLVYKKKIQAKTFSSVRLLATPGDCKRLLVLLATPGVVCILVVPVVPNKKIR